MRLERLKRDGEVAHVLREYDRRGDLLSPAAYAIVSEMDVSVGSADVRFWLRRMVDLRPHPETWSAKLSRLIVRTSHADQPHRIEGMSGGHWSIPDYTHTLGIWLDLLKHTAGGPQAAKASKYSRVDWRPTLKKVLPSSYGSEASPDMRWVRRPFGWLCCVRRPEFGERIEDQTPVSISFNGSVVAGVWCPPLPAFDHDLEVIR